VFLGVELIAPDVNATFWSNFSNLWKRLLPGNDSLTSSSDNSALQTILEEAYPIGDTVSFDCYSPMNTDLQLKITLLNPDEFEILSFTLNGVKYQSYQFAWGSDSEHLYLTVNSGSIPGGKEYTIDQIKYVDGTEIKDVLIEGDQTVTLGVSYRSVVRSVTDSLDITPTSVSFHVQILDLESLFANSQTYIKAILYDGGQLLGATDLVIGSNDVTISGLEIGKSYTAVVFSEYDMLDGNGNRLVVLDSFTFDTEEPVLVSNLEVDQSSVSFTLKENDPLEIGTLVSVDLMQGETMIAQINSFGTFSFSALYSNFSTSLLITYEYELDGEQISWAKTITFTTLEKQLPSVSFETSSLSQEGVNLMFTMSDVDQTFVSYAIEVSQNGHLVDTYTVDGNDISISSLYSNTTYLCSIIVTYDLNDQTGSHSVSYQTEFTTEEKTPPTLTVELVSVDQTSAILSYSLTDEDQVILNTQYRLLLNGTDVESVSNNDNVIYPVSLYSNTQYCLQMVFQYDLNDQMGIHTATEEYYFTTEANSIPVITLHDATISSSSFSVPYDITDPDNTVSIKTIEIRDSENSNLTWSEESNILTCTSLMSNSDYSLVISITYNLNDQTGDHILSLDQSYKTIKAEPDITITYSNLTQNQVDYEITIDDPDEAAIISRVYAVVITANSTPYEPDNSVTVELSTTDIVGTLTNLDSNRVHVVYVEYSYQSSDISSPVSLQYQQAFTTPKMPVIYGKDSSTPTTDSISVLVSEMNEDGVLQTNKSFTLYNSDKSQIISTEFDIQPEMLWGWVFQYEYLYEGLLSNNDFVLVISYQADLNDGLGLRDITQEFTLHTLSKSIPVISFSEIVPEQTSVSWILSENDPDGIGYFTDVKVYKGTTLLYSSEDTSPSTLLGLTANTKYTITANYVYDASDGVGDVTISMSQTFWTKPLPLTLSSISMSSFQAYAVGEDVTVNITFSNPSFVQILSIEYAGENHEFSNIVTSMCSINLGKYDDPGTYEFVFTKVTYKINDITYEQIFTTDNSISFDVLGELTLLNVTAETTFDYVDDAIDGGNPGYLIIEMENINSYQVYSISVRYDTTFIVMVGAYPMEVRYVNEYTYTGDEIIVIDQNHIKILWLGRGFYESMCPYDNFSVEGFSYGYSEAATRTNLYSGIGKGFFIMNSFTPRNVTNATELANMVDGYIFQLQNDIDLEGVVWTPKNFNGVFLGNGHTISNLMINLDIVSAGTFIYDPMYPDGMMLETRYTIGLFGQVKGVISDLNLSNFTISVSYGRTPDYWGQDTIFIGLLLGEGADASVRNVSANGTLVFESLADPVYFIIGGIGGNVHEIVDSSIDVEISVNAVANGMIGGISGVSTVIKHCTVTSSISGSIQYGFIGGAVGYGNFLAENTITTDITLTSTSYYSSIGGGVGQLSQGTATDNLVLDSSLSIVFPNSTGNTSRVGGFVGSSIYSSDLIHNLVDCDITLMSASPIYFGSLFGYAEATASSNPMIIQSNIFWGDVLVTTYSTINQDPFGKIVGYSTLNDNRLFANSTFSYNNNELTFDSSLYITTSQLSASGFYDSIGFSNDVWDFDSLNEFGMLTFIK